MLLGAVVGKVVVRVALLLDQRKAVRDDIVQMICNMQNMRNTTRNQPTNQNTPLQQCMLKSAQRRAATEEPRKMARPSGGHCLSARAGLAEELTRNPVDDVRRPDVVVTAYLRAKRVRRNDLRTAHACVRCLFTHRKASLNALKSGCAACDGKKAPPSC